MTVFSIIVPSFNQDKYIEETLKNLSDLKASVQNTAIGIEVILVDNCSDQATSDIITRYKPVFDKLLIEKDLGQYDAINKGMKMLCGDYWTWLNTDDLIDIAGFLKMADYLVKHPEVDYVYGGITYIDANSNILKTSESGDLTLSQLVRENASISQPGSFFRTAFTTKIGELRPYQFAFDYEYILRCLKNKAVVVNLKGINLSFFRYYSNSKSGSKDFRFLKEQLDINAAYGGKVYYKLRFTLLLRILKRKLIN